MLHGMNHQVLKHILIAAVPTGLKYSAPRGSSQPYKTLNLYRKICTQTMSKTILENKKYGNNA